VGTKKKRLMISLSPEVEETLERLKKSMGVAPSRLIAGILDEALPSLQGIAEATELAREKKTRGGAFRLYEKTLTKALQETLALQSGIQEEADKLDDISIEPPND